MHFDDLLTDYLGEYGRYQIGLFCLVALTAIPTAFFTMGIVFLAAVPEHWCSVPELDHLKGNNSGWEEMIMNLTLPPSANSEGYSSCSMYDRNYTGWTADDVMAGLREDVSNLSLIGCRSGWTYSDITYTSTITTEWDLVCDKKTLQATASSIFQAGFIPGSLIIGSLADQYGRKPLFCVCLVLLTAVTVGLAFSPNIFVFFALRFFSGFFTIALYTTAYVIAVEIFGTTARAHAGIAFAYFWAVGYMLYAVFGFFIRDWRTLQLASSCTCASLLLLIVIVPESPRWLYSRKKQKKGNKIARKIAKWNNRTLPESLDVTVQTHQRGYIWDLVRTPRMRCRTFNVMFNCFANSLVYYGLSLNTSNLGGNDFVYFFISGGVEIPAYIFAQLSIAYLGRRWPLAGTMVIGGLALLCIIPIPENYPNLVVTLAIIGKFCVTSSYGIIYFLTAEIYPTVLRTVGVAIGTFAGPIGGFAASYVGLLAKYGSWVPTTIFGVASVAAGLLALLFPETKGKQLPETIEEGEAFGLKQMPSKAYTIERMQPMSTKETSQFLPQNE